MRRLNLGSGTTKIKNTLNVDCNIDIKPDVVLDVSKPLPFPDETFDEIYFFHCIEHIEKFKHYFVLREIHRVLKLDGILYISYPEFSEILKHWLANTNQDRKFWEATIYGRQSYEGDYHYSAMDSLELQEQMANVGFKVLNTQKEPKQSFNTVMKVSRGAATPLYEEVLYREVFRPCQ